MTDEELEQLAKIKWASVHSECINDMARELLSLRQLAKQRWQSSELIDANKKIESLEAELKISYNATSEDRKQMAEMSRIINKMARETARASEKGNG